MSTILLRTMTRLSKITQGKNTGLQVGEVLSKSKIDLVYAYFHYELLTYTDDILDELHIKPEDRIAKPGKAPEKFEYYSKRNHYQAAKYILRRDKYSKPDADGIMKNVIGVIKRRNKSKAKSNYKALIERERRQFSKGAMQARNQGKY